MKKNIHPPYYPHAKIVCSCGKIIEDVGSTIEILKTELCSACHPFYSGIQKYVDTGGRIEKFEKKRNIAKEKKEAAIKPKEKPIQIETKEKISAKKKIAHEKKPEIKATKPTQTAKKKSPQKTKKK